ncbi:response regulator transcription factor [Paracoccus sp. M683]|uniref:response regulator transcription factor n=1 Tax=Paracoccus sp. M683 TaxID=2594268 RepID=UPI00117E798B|nr:response regulator transcription factor [Paracoccus sp. M683]TRW99730.1 response regulator transcription factor [Paracoccus sp. M683]
MQPNASPPESSRNGQPRRIETALIVEDHPLFSDAISITLRMVRGITDVTAVETLNEAVARLTSGPAPDIILLDLNLPDVDGLEGLLQVRRAAPGALVLIVSSVTDPRIIAAAIGAGAAGFVPKHSQRHVYQSAFDAVASGQTFLPEGTVLPRAGDATPGNAAVDRVNSLTAQQARILALICEGKFNKQIAHELSIAETTVKAHVTSIMRKLGVHSRTQAVLVAQEARIGSLGSFET